MVDGRELLFLTPSLKVTGGNLEIIRLARKMGDRGQAVRLVAMWRTSNEADVRGLSVTYLSSTAISARSVVLEMPAVATHFRALTKPTQTIVASHYVTFPLAWLVPRQRRWFFVQDLEWLFVDGRTKQALLRRLILGSLRRGGVISANPYLTGQLRGCGIDVAAEAAIWADPQYENTTEAERTIDVCVMLRRGAHKRADLTLELLKDLSHRLPQVRVAAISPDGTYRASLPAHVQYIERPTLSLMRSLYGITKIFVLMSDHEGFGLPPLEAMGSGCVPLCRDAGGVANYMLRALEANVLPRDASVSAMTDAISSLLNDDSRRHELSALARTIFVEGQRASVTRVDTLMAAGFGK